MDIRKNIKNKFILLVKKSKVIRMVSFTFIFMYIFLRNLIREMKPEVRRRFAIVMSVVLVISIALPCGIMISTADDTNGLLLESDEIDTLVDEFALGSVMSSGDEILSDNGILVELLTVSVNETASENEVVSDNSTISENGVVSDNSTLSENGIVSDNSVVSENEVVSDNSTLSGNEIVSDNSTVSGNGTLSDNSTVSGNETVSENVVTPEIILPDTITITYGDSLKDITIRSNDTNGSFSFADEESIPQVKDTTIEVIYTPNEDNVFDYTQMNGYQADQNTVLCEAPILVQPATLVITAPNMQATVGDKVPSLMKEDYFVMGLCNEDTLDVIKGLDETGYGVTELIAPGTIYSIQPVELLAENYAITYLSGELKVLPKNVDDTFFTVQGTMSSRIAAYVSDITITPTGKDGFDKVRIGETGEFKDFVVLDKDTMNGSELLYFAKGNAISQAYTYTYVMDGVAPVIDRVEKINESGENTLLDWFVGTSDVVLKVKVSDYMISQNELSEAGSGISYLQYEKGDTAYMEPVENGYATIRLSEEETGMLKLYCYDAAGNCSAIKEMYTLSDMDAPMISLVPSEEYEKMQLPYHANFTVEETGEEPSGIAYLEYSINGEEMIPVTMEESATYQVFDTIKNEQKKEVPSACSFYVDLPENGVYEVEVNAFDYAGNRTVEKYHIEVAGSDIIRIVLPTTFDLYVAPGLEQENGNIFSNQVQITNLSEFDVDISLNSLDFTQRGIDQGKNCELYLNSSALDQAIKVEDGKTNDVFRFTLGTTETTQEAKNAATFEFYGDVTSGESLYWSGNDISLNMLFSFSKSEKASQGGVVSQNEVVNQ